MEQQKSITKVQGVTLHTFPEYKDARGVLSVGNFEREIPFIPKRFFYIYGVPSNVIRGEHAHLRCHQFLMALKGSVSVIADDGQTREEFILNQPNIGIYLPAMTWGVEYRYSADAILLVFASDYYEPEGYIHDYDAYVKQVKS